MPQEAVRSARRGDANMITTFFDGESEATGIVTDRFGRLRRTFHMAMNGYWSAGTFILDERLTFGDGEVETRLWRIVPEPAGSFTATAKGVAGLVRGEARGDATRMDYAYEIVAGGRRLTLAFEDRMYRIDARTLANRVVMRKFGIRVGEIVAMFTKSAPPSG
jgi:hypothetical protein